MVSLIDKEYLEKIRENVNRLIKSCAASHDYEDIKILEIAPQNYKHDYFKKAKIDTLDINPESGATYIADLCLNNSKLIPDESYDVVICTEVLEHTRQPFDAVFEIKRMLKPEGIVFASTPFNFRIHGPLPDCWRFTEHGLRELFKDFRSCFVVDLQSDRFLMPIHYTVIAKK